jgi:hypothetical protein
MAKRNFKFDIADRANRCDFGWVSPRERIILKEFSIRLVISHNVEGGGCIVNPGNHCNFPAQMQANKKNSAFVSNTTKYSRSRPLSLA